MSAVQADIVESDSGLIERATVGSDTTGPAATFDVQFTSGGQGGGAVELEFVARRKC